MFEKDSPRFLGIFGSFPDSFITSSLWWRIIQAGTQEVIKTKFQMIVRLENMLKKKIFLMWRFITVVRQTKYEYFEYKKNTKFFGHITTNKWTQIVGSSLDKWIFYYICGFPQENFLMILSKKVPFPEWYMADGYFKLWLLNFFSGRMDYFSEFIAPVYSGAAAL